MDNRKTIFKYSLGQRVNQVIMLSVRVGFKPLCVRIQGPSICMWGIVPKEKSCNKRIRLAVVGTGRDIPDSILRWEHVGTVETPAMEIYHIFKDDYEQLESEEAPL